MPGARLAGAAATREAIGTDSGFAIVPTHDFAACPQADILCVPGGHGVVNALGDPDTIDFVARPAAGAKWVTRVCTGALLLSRAGLPAGRRAPTPWAYTHLLSRVGAAKPDARPVGKGWVLTCKSRW